MVPVSTFFDFCDYAAFLLIFFAFAAVEGGLSFGQPKSVVKGA